MQAVLDYRGIRISIDGIANKFQIHKSSIRARITKYDSMGQQHDTSGISGLHFRFRCIEKGVNL